MVKQNLNLEADDLQITPHLNMECLPQMLKECLSVAKTPATRDMLLLSVLTATSSVMNPVSFRYAHYGKRYYPNLLTFLMAGAASGKGVADLATKLIQPIHDATPLLIPGDSTYPAFFLQLLEQQGKGLLFETEGSVITDIWKSSCANYNTALRKCAEHETLSKSRVLLGTMYIHEPKVSMLLTGTCSQFQHLVPSVENGFFSRLNMLMVRDTQPFDGSVFMPSNEGQETERIYSYWAAQLKHWYDNHVPNLHDNPSDTRIEFQLTQEQAQKIGSVMESEYGTYLKQLGDGFHATIVRNAITHVRIACILTVLRSLTESEANGLTAEGGLTSNSASGLTSDSASGLTCSDEDFETAMVISTKLLLNAADAYNQIGGQDQPSVPEVKGSYQKDTFLASLPTQFSTGECVKQGQVMGVSRRSTERWLQSWVETGVLQKADYGSYAKVSA